MMEVRRGLSGTGIVRREIMIGRKLITSAIGMAGFA
jgi:hypothetical protein